MSLKYSKEDMDKAVAAVKTGQCSFGQASKKFGVPKTTLVGRVNGKVKLEKRGRKQDLPPEVEKSIIDKVLLASKSGFPLTKKQLLIKIGQAATELKITTRFKNNVPSDMYWRGLKKRHPELAIRTPEVLPICRMKMLSPEVVDGYFDSLESLLSSTGLNEHPECIWNCDETGFQFQHDPSRVVACKGQRSVSSPASQNRENITVMATINAAGNAMPPMIIAKGKTQKSLQGFATSDAPEDALWAYQKSGWITNEIFQMWFQQLFLPHCGEKRPQLLILDSHGSHEKLEVIQLARQNSIHVLALPPHTTHILQPLDRAIFGPMKKKYNSICTVFLTENPHTTVKKATWPRILKGAWEASLQAHIVRKAFQATGIFPCDRKAIPADSFLPSKALCPQDQPSANVTSATISSATPADISMSEAATDNALQTPPTTDSILTIAEVHQVPSTDMLGLDFNIPLDTSFDLGTDFTSVLSPDDCATPETAEMPASDIDRLFHQIQVKPANWNQTVDTIFGLPQKDTTKVDTPKRKPPILKARLLTSDEIMTEKQRQQEEKEQKELAKEQRKQKKLASSKAKKSQ